jgi:membrane protein
MVTTSATKLGTIRKARDRVRFLVSIRRVVATVYNDINNEHLFVFAAGLSYYFVLSLFPLLILLSAALAYLPIPGLFNQVLGAMARLVPADSMGLVNKIALDVTTARRAGILTFGIVFTLWTASSGFAATIDGLDMVYRVRETRPVWKTRPLALGLAVIVGSLLVLALLLMTVGPRLGEWLAQKIGLGTVFLYTWPYLRWGIAVLFAVCGVELLYYLAPNLKQRLWHHLPGAVFAVACWMGLSFLLGLYFRQENLTITYGTLGAGIALYIWFYLTGFAILLGGELNFVLPRGSQDSQIIRATATGEKGAAA